jgi:polyisoprenoid-binding protein YceI
MHTAPMNRLIYARLFILPLLLHAASWAQAARYEIDTAATKATYETKYLGFISIRGVFERMTGTLQYDSAKPVAERDAAIHVVIDATSLKPVTFDSDNKRQMLRGPEFFNVEKYPTIEFRSTRFRFEGERLVAIDGQVKLVGVTKPATLVVLKSGCEPATTERQARCTAQTEWIVKRFEYGMNGWAHTVSDEVIIRVNLVANQPPRTKDDAPIATTQP